MKKILLGLFALALLFSSAYAKEVLQKFQANGKSYEIFIGSENGVYVNYAGVTDTKYEKGSSSSCEFKRYGSCVSKSSMIADIISKVKNNKY